MSEKQWYEDLPREEIEGKHVRAVLSSGTVIEGRLEFGIGSLITVGSPSERNYILKAGVGWSLMEGVERLDLVWDERDWYRIDAKDVIHGDAVVVNGRLCTVDKAWPGDYHPQVVTDTPGRMLVDLGLIPFALRRKVNVPSKPGFYKDTLGRFWARSAKSADGGPWWHVDPDALDKPARSDKYMSILMPLTPVHFVDGEAEEHDGTGPFEGLVQHLMSKTPASDGRAA